MHTRYLPRIVPGATIAVMIAVVMAMPWVAYAAGTAQAATDLTNHPTGVYHPGDHIDSIAIATFSASITGVGDVEGRGYGKVQDELMGGNLKNGSVQQQSGNNPSVSWEGDPIEPGVSRDLTSSDIREDAYTGDLWACAYARFRLEGEDWEYMEAPQGDPNVEEVRPNWHDVTAHDDYQYFVQQEGGGEG